MRHLKMIGLCLVAVFALGAVAASAAQAEGPEWGRCVKLAKNKGKYKDANCQELEGKTNGKGEFKAKAKGVYEWVGGVANMLPRTRQEGQVQGRRLHRTRRQDQNKGVFTPKAKGEYEKVAAGGKFTGTGGKPSCGVLIAFASTAKTGLEIAERGKRYTDATCSLTAGGERCGVVSSPPRRGMRERVVCWRSDGHERCGERRGDASRDACCLERWRAARKGPTLGEIVVNTLKGELGYINKAKQEVGVLLKPATGTVFVSFRCFNEEEGANSEFVVGVGNETEGAAYKPEATGGNDGIISPITPVDAMTPTLTQQYTVSHEENGQIHEAYENSWAYNVPQKFESGPVTELELVDQAGEAYEKGEPQESSLWSEAGEEVTNVATPEGDG